MLVRGILAAAVGTVFHHSSWDKKGKTAAATMLPTSSRKNYGSAGRSERRASTQSTSRSVERLDSVPEQTDDSLTEEDRAQLNWNEAEEDGDECDSEEEEIWDTSQYDYRRAWRLYSIVPIGSALFLVFTALLPDLISRKSLPTSPPATRIMLSLILSASLWCLGHSIRVPLFTTLNAILSGIASASSTICCSNSRRTSRRLATAADYISVFTTIVHVFLVAFLQESLRIASFAILNLHWYQSGGLSLPTRQPRARDAAFRDVWALAFGWALAEVVAGVVQGYEQLALYADIDPTRRSSEASSKSGNDDVPLEGGIPAVFDEEAADLVRWSMPCVGMADDEDVEGAKAMTQVEIDSALLKLANVRAMDELEALYGQPYIEIPVFVILLQRLDSILLALGNTLLLSAAYLPRPPYSSSLSLFTPPNSSLPLDHLPSHTHMLPLVPTFFIVSLVHAALGVLHAPPVLARVGLPAAAYASCIVGLALTFAGIGVWIGLW